MPFHEPGLEEVIARAGDRLRFTLDAREAVEGARFVFVCVGTPATYSGDADLSAVWTVLDELHGLEEGAVLVMKSTVPVGTGEKVRAALAARGLEQVGYVSNPEFLAEGSAVKDFLEPDRIVIGAFEDADGDAVERLHEGLDAPVVRRTSPRPRWSSWPRTPTSARGSASSTRSPTCASWSAPTSRRWRGGWASRPDRHALPAGRIGFGGSCFPKDISFLSCSRATPATTSSC